MDGKVWCQSRRSVHNQTDPAYQYRRKSNAVHGKVCFFTNIFHQVMFCFAGLVGMGIESKRIRNWLAFSAFPLCTHAEDMPQETVVEPSSYRGSFNPFPALVIGVTGAAMAAHAQTYLFQECQSSELN